ncbi:thiol oxidoreductase [Leptospira gomenensis]|uniref:Thiol oxidoreductase n=2 Tax=Leptospira gomenensis TaxID=2484974 RepID=A0A5F1YE67_9LEPT|nr:di-heme oxidoredictase family protein [Leptospira gomenensis]TGK34336.1 thiol oxidoreductase [Leptospira gomenensis]TGK37302.1 thiol oxidoreductase [Leptospira gomenensis]TGK50989.1 thiol oxidoreductase [Leptospira gomenensis]TGK56611.1 thiol oxidoreductase [Leptospira gomenensis]
MKNKNTTKKRGTPRSEVSFHSYLRKGLMCIALFVSFSGCGDVDPFRSSPKGDRSAETAAILLYLQNQDPGEQYSGGWTTTFDDTVNAFDLVAANLRDGGNIEFQGGNSFFNRDWVQPGNSASVGLGPVFNNNSCNGCHVKDGRGTPPASGSSAFTTILIRLSKDGKDPITGGPIGLDNYGLQLNDKGIPGIVADPTNYPAVPEEAIATVNFTEEPGAFPDGEAYSLRRPTFTITGWNFGDPTGDPSGFHMSPRTSPMIPGLGLLAAIPESTILSFADENDADGDGISGKPNFVWDAKLQKKTLGRFGWKANEPNLNQQNQGAFLGDIGITSPLFPNPNCVGTQTDCFNSTPGNNGTPEGTEISARTADLVTFYTTLVGAPGRRNWTSPDVIRGKEIFTEIGCNTCHKPYVFTGALEGFPEVSFQHIKPYTDLLLHDMGADLSDNRPDFEATGNEWRTAPLWGTGLIPKVNGHNHLLHDGRARGHKEAILWHGGEALEAKNKFVALPKSDRDKLILFLESL